MEIQSRSPQETSELGERLGALLQPGDVVLLSGELGAGKTVFVQGIARGLGFEGRVSSKSFVLLGEYQGRVKLYHADLYRLEEPEQVAELALEEVCADGVLVVEWPERAQATLPRELLTVRFEMTSEYSRLLRFTPGDKRGQEILRQLVAKVATGR
jgi:tRNA threonylcarbamoyladenosine biosynthesis protein TsaE